MEAPNRLKYRDRQGRPLTSDEWGALFESGTDGPVACDTPRAGVIVDTVWIGCAWKINHRGEPLIFETLVIEAGTPIARYEWATEAEARAGHASILRWIGHGLPLTEQEQEPAEPTEPRH